MHLPSLYPVRQTAPQPQLVDVAASVRAAWLSSPVAQQIRPGMRIAVGAGSRGIRHHALLVKATVDALRELGAAPLVIAAMGSHGGATPQGQRNLLAGYGITESALGVPVLTDMGVVNLGQNSWGEPVWFDRNAFGCDGVVTVSRVKPHTDFRGVYESGIVKMLAIGFGKREGADQHHNYGTRGLRDMIPESAKVILAKAPVLAGLAVLENAREETARVEVVPAADILAREPALLVEAKGLLGRLPFADIDALLVCECGKNYSGAGIDPNVVGRMLIEASPEMESNRPRVVRMACLDISPESHGNGTGVGIADLTTARAIAAIDPLPFRMNNLTARFLWRSKLPLSFGTDREVIEAMLTTCWQPKLDAVRACVIPNTLEVAELWVTAPLADEARATAGLEVGQAAAWPFTADGRLDAAGLFPRGLCGRRPAAGR